MKHFRNPNYDLLDLHASQNLFLKFWELNILLISTVASDEFLFAFVSYSHTNYLCCFFLQ